KDVLLDDLLSGHVDHVSRGNRARSVADRLSGRPGRIAPDIEPVVLTEAAIPGVTPAADLVEVVKPQLQLRRVCRHRADERCWHQAHHHPPVGRLAPRLQASAPDDLAARLHADEGLDIPYLSAMPVLAAVRESRRIIANRQRCTPAEGAFRGLPPVTEKAD